jgi:hypothetical protein
MITCPYGANPDVTWYGEQAACKVMPFGLPESSRVSVQPVGCDGAGYENGGWQLAPPLLLDDELLDEDDPPPEPDELGDEGQPQIERAKTRADEE